MTEQNAGRTSAIATALSSVIILDDETGEPWTLNEWLSTGAINMYANAIDSHLSAGAATHRADTLREVRIAILEKMPTSAFGFDNPAYEDAFIDGLETALKIVDGLLDAETTPESETPEPAVAALSDTEPEGEEQLEKIARLRAELNGLLAAG